MNETDIWEVVASNFGLCVQGYHMLNTDPIKEAVWEQINTQIFKHSGIQVVTQACGSHSPGCDIETNVGKFSNKSAKYDKNSNEFSISSYRLTSVTNVDSPGTPEAFCTEINKRKNFDYYSVILREELPNCGGFKYDWYLIPSEYPALSPQTFNWMPLIGKRGKNAGKQIGWETVKSNGETVKSNGETVKSNGETGDSMSITFSMSSQLWIQVKVTEELKHFIIASATYYGEHPQIDYITLAKKENQK
jgi:hypothetical protein